MPRPPRALSDDVGTGSAKESAPKQKLGGVIRPNVVGHGAKPRLDLAAIVAAASPPARRSAEIVRIDAAPPRPPAPATLKQRARQMSVYLEPPVYDQLRELAHNERTKMHALMLEALDLLFKQRGTRSIEQITGTGRR